MISAAPPDSPFKNLVRLMLHAVRVVEERTGTPVAYGPGWYGGRGLSILCARYLALTTVLTKDPSEAGISTTFYPCALLADELTDLCFRLRTCFENPDAGTVAFYLVMILLRRAGYEPCIPVQGTAKPQQIRNPDDPNLKRRRQAFENLLALPDERREGLRRHIRTGWCKPSKPTGVKD